MPRRKQKWKPYNEAKLWVHKLKIANYVNWLNWVKRNKLPKGIPRSPKRVYGNDYVSDMDWLGHQEYLPYSEVKAYAQSKGIKSFAKWVNHHKWYKPKRIPRYPDIVYTEWENWGTFLGTGNIQPYFIVWRSYAEAVKEVQHAGLKSANAYRKWRKENSIKDLPAFPENIYAKWKGYGEWLGKTLLDKMSGAEINALIFYVLVEPDTPPNVYTFGFDSRGKTSLLKRQEQEKFKIGKTWKVDPKQADRITSVVNSLATTWIDGRNDQFIVPNIYDLIEQIDLCLVVDNLTC